MDSTLYKKLEDSNAENCWKLCKNVVANQLMGDNVFPVPSLREATNFDIGHIVLKRRRTKLEKMVGTQSTAVPVGELVNFLKDDTSLDTISRLGAVERDTTATLNPLYEFHETDMKHGLKKTVTVHLLNCEKWRHTHVPGHGDLVLDFQTNGYIHLDRFFLITEVFYASEVTIHVAVGDKEDDFILKGRIPVGFTMMRYTLTEDGMIDKCKRARTGRWNARWVKKLTRDHTDPLPFDPFATRLFRGSIREGTLKEEAI